MHEVGEEIYPQQKFWFALKEYLCIAIIPLNRSCLMFEIVENSSLFTAMSWSAHSAVYSIISSHAQKHGKGTSALRATLSEAEQQSLNKWNTSFSSQTAEALVRYRFNLLVWVYKSKILKESRLKQNGNGWCLCSVKEILVCCWSSSSK